jgi:hypothetical protein
MDVLGVDLQLVFYYLVRCFFQDEQAFVDVRQTADLTGSALLVVAGASLVAGFGGLLWTVVAAEHVAYGRFLLRSVLVGSSLQVALFLVWVSITCWILRRASAIEVGYAELVRLMGYAFAPVALQAFLFIPALAQPIGIIALAGTFFVATSAIYRATDVSAAQALGACLAGFAVFCLVLGFLGGQARNWAPGIFALGPNAFSVGIAPTGRG